jgi:transporter family-2 protein
MKGETIVYYALSAVTGMIISVMIMINGMFANHSGVYTSAFLIHLSGLAAISMSMFIKRDFKKVFRTRLPLYVYTGGVVGVLTILFNNMAYSKIDVSAILALTLLGQSVTSLFFDHYGFLGMKTVRFSLKKIIGIAFVLLGVLFMISLNDITKLVPIILSFITGITIVLSRTINGKLAVETNVNISTWFNYLTGTIVSFIVFLFFMQSEPLLVPAENPLIFTGGLVGVCAVFITNVCVSKISSFYMTLLLFTGQIFTGVIIDIILSQSFSPKNLIGGIIITIGLALDMWVNKKRLKKEPAKAIL